MGEGGGKEVKGTEFFKNGGGIKGKEIGKREQSNPDLFLSNYNYYLPPELIAKYPVEPRDSARLLVYNRKNGEVKHTTFKNLLQFVPPEVHFIFNNTKVIKARLWGQKESGGKVELLLNRPVAHFLETGNGTGSTMEKGTKRETLEVDGIKGVHSQLTGKKVRSRLHSAEKPTQFEVYIRGRVKVGTKLYFPSLKKPYLGAEVVELLSDGTRIVHFFKISDNPNLQIKGIAQKGIAQKESFTIDPSNSDFLNNSNQFLQNRESLKGREYQKNGKGSELQNFFSHSPNGNSLKIGRLNSYLDFEGLLGILDQIGEVPIPPYLNRKPDKSDEVHYQAIFASQAGAVAAPTASLHFTSRLMKQIQNSHFLTLHVGAGTFKPVESPNILNHQIHSEYYQIPLETAKIIDSKKPIVAVGTTSVRAIEYYYRTGKLTGECNLFLHPLNPPQRVDHLITNFHLPKSTLLMLVSAFVGRERCLELYREAVKEGYRFYSYGDGMLII